MLKADREMEDLGSVGSEGAREESESGPEVEEGGADALEWAQEMNKDAHQQWDPARDLS